MLWGTAGVPLPVEESEEKLQDGHKPKTHLPAFPCSSSEGVKGRESVFMTINLFPGWPLPAGTQGSFYCHPWP